MPAKTQKSKSANKNSTKKNKYPPTNTLTEQSATWDLLDTKGMVLTNFVKANNFLMRYICQEFDAATAIIYLTILSHRNFTTNKCFPSISLIAREVGIGRPKVTKAIKSLLARGILEIDELSSTFKHKFFLFPYEDFYKESKQDDFSFNDYESIDDMF